MTGNNTIKTVPSDLVRVCKTEKRKESLVREVSKKVKYDTRHLPYSHGNGESLLVNRSVILRELEVTGG